MLRAVGERDLGLGPGGLQRVDQRVLHRRWTVAQLRGAGEPRLHGRHLPGVRLANIESQLISPFSRIPPELVQAHAGRKIDFHMVRKSEEYVAPKPKPFSGEGNRLGSVVPNIVGGPSSSEAAKPPAPQESARLLAEAQAAVGLQDGEPTTRIQIRVAGSQPIVGTFNQTHTVEHIRTFIVG